MTDEAPLFAGVEIGGTKLVCILAAGPDRVLELVRIPTTTPAETLGAALRTVSAWAAARPLAALGLASFGPLDLRAGSATHGCVTATPKPGWAGADLLAAFRSLGLPMAIETDVTGAALAEGQWGGAQGLRSWAYITVGTGVGAGVIVDGRPVSGLTHPEAGHVRVGRLPGDSWPGSCPFHGDCVEGLASGTAIRAHAGAPAETLPASHPALETAAHAVAGLVQSLALIAAPEKVLVGGGVFPEGSPLLVRVRAHLAHGLNGYVPALAEPGTLDTYVTSPGLGAMAGPLGAIAVARSAVA